MADDLRKKGDMGRYPDDDWRQILEANGFHPSGAMEEIWRSSYSDVKVQIGVNRDTEEPFYQIIAEDGERSPRWRDLDTLKSVLAQEPESPQLSSEEAKREDSKLLERMGIVGTLRESTKYAGRMPMFSFAVPIKAGGPVAFALAKAGLDNFQADNFKDFGFTQFTFPTEPEMHVGEEIVKQEFAKQISNHSEWAQWKAQTNEPAQPGATNEPAQKHYMSNLKVEWKDKVAGQWGERSYDSDQVHDILDAHRPKGEEGRGFEEPIPDNELPVLLKKLNQTPVAGSDDNEHYLGVIVFLTTHGSNVPATYRERARQIALSLTQDEEYLNSWRNPDLRRTELEHEIELLEGSGKTAATDVEVKRMQVYRRKKLLAWASEMGVDLSDELKHFDEGDFWQKDQVYEEVRDMIRDHRKSQSHYRRIMRGKQ